MMQVPAFIQRLQAVFLSRFYLSNVFEFLFERFNVYDTTENFSVTMPIHLCAFSTCKVIILTFWVRQLQEKCQEQSINTIGSVTVCGPQ